MTPAERAEQREGPVSTPVGYPQVPVWKFSTMPVPEGPGDLVVVREEGQHVVALLRGATTGLWLPLHLAPRSLIYNVPETPQHPGVPSGQQPMPFGWWRDQYLALSGLMDKAWAVVIPGFDAW